MAVTIKDIARMAGVSPATVSKIINNYDDVGEDTKRKVMKIMEETGYKPSFSAKTLTTKKTNIIGVIYAGKVNADLNHPFFVEVLNSFKKAIGTFGYDLLVFSNEKFHLSEEAYLERCRFYQLDGCIIINGTDIQSSIYDLDKSEVPCIGVEIPLHGPNSSYVITENEKVSSSVVEHFYLLGYRKIGYIGGLDNMVNDIRTKAFRDSLQQFGLEVNEDWIVSGDYYEESGYEAMKGLLELPDIPEAVFVGSDMMAFGAIRAIKESGRKVPDDIAVIGCDDISASQYIDPPLTTVRQNKEKIGKLAAYILIDLINKQTKTHSIEVEPELVVRSSCGSKLKKA